MLLEMTFPAPKFADCILGLDIERENPFRALIPVQSVPRSGWQPY
jgi:hypothetical protein